MNALTDATNFLALHERLWCCGQPDAAQLRDAAGRGVEVVINLGLHDNPPWSLEGEPELVRSLGMTYVHVPVVFEDPRPADLRAFFDALGQHRGRHLLVHCAANWRVTAFLGLHRALVEGLPDDEAFAPMRSVWQPDATWQRFIDTALGRAGSPAIYFAGAIRGGRERHELFARLIAHIGHRARVLTEHVGDPDLTHRGEGQLSDRHICERDRRWLESSDAVVAEVTTPSLGVGWELGLAQTLGTPALCLFDTRPGHPLSAMIAGNPAFEVVRYASEDEARAAIDAFLEGLGTPRTPTPDPE